MRRPLFPFFVSILAFPCVSRVMANEGMWTYDNPPLEQLQKEYKFSPTQAWLDHVRLASVRINDGGSGSFVSPDGLVMTNHHVALGAIQKLSTKERNLVQDGFKAGSKAEELKVPDMEINVLVGMANMTDRVNAAVPAGATEDQARKAREAEMARIEKESADATGLRSDIVSLYHGGEYWLYTYKKYTDIRLVMAPEMQAAFFGGDSDNFSYPRYALDMTFLRVYENGEPLKVEHYMPLSRKGAQENELVFVSGHPGHTSRLMTLAQLQFERDHTIAEVFDNIRSQTKALQDYSAQGPEQERQAKSAIFSLDNARKVYEGRRDGLKEAKVFSRKEAEEFQFRQDLGARPDLQAQYGGAWDKIAEARRLDLSTLNERMYRRIGGSKAANLASTLLRWVTEIEKPNEERWAEFRESALESLKLRLLSPAPIYKEMEKAALTASLALSMRKLSADDAFLAEALQGMTPEQAAAAAIDGTRLDDAAYRKELLEGGRAAVEGSSDPLLVLMRKLEPYYREQRDRYEKTVQAVETEATAMLAKARFALYGKKAYPDATFTLRLSYGKVAGFEQLATRVPYKTTYHGLFDRAESFDQKGDYALSPKVAAAKGRIRMDTPMNMVTTNDIIGGNSGSPIVNANGEVVGLVFDGNIQSLIGDYVFEPEQNRTVAVHSAGILEALDNIYEMPELSAELSPVPVAPEGPGLAAAGFVVPPMTSTMLAMY